MRALVAEVLDARVGLRKSEEELHRAMLKFSDLIDQRGDEEYELAADEDEGNE